MLKRIYTKKIITCLIALFATLLIYLIPSNEEVINYEEKIEYVNKDIRTNTIFLLDSNNYLASTKIIIEKTNTTDIAKELINALIIDSSMQDKIPSGFKSIIPSGTTILSLTYDNNVIKVDFSDDLMNTSTENEERIIEAIVYTLTSIDNVDFVIVYMNGEILTKLPKSKINLPSTLDRSIGINKEYNLTSTKGITKTTIYYISKFNDDIYYVPVTKVNNDTRSKIEIIIDELSSTNVYKSNLMSYLNSNTEIISVNENKNELVINFNSAILGNINTKDILEEVIYTISMSVSDNYNVETVILSVENEEIHKSVLKSIE